MPPSPASSRPWRPWPSSAAGSAGCSALLTPLASFLILCTMAVAAGMVHIPAGHPFVASTGGPSYEPALGYLAIALLLLLAGPGRLSLDWLLFGRRWDTTKAVA